MKEGLPGGKLRALGRGFHFAKPLCEDEILSIGFNKASQMGDHRIGPPIASPE